MRLDNYLIERHTIKKLEKDDFDTSIRKYCSKSLDSYFFRGEHSTEKYIYVQPDLERRSPYAKNILLSNLPSWRDYPKRENSLICSSSDTKAREYNNSVYKVVPLNGAKIGVCPSEDIWFSFKDVYTLNEVNYCIEELIFLLKGNMQVKKENSIGGGNVIPRISYNRSR